MAFGLKGVFSPAFKSIFALKRAWAKCTDLPEPLLLTSTMYGCSWRLRPKFRPLALQDVSAWALTCGFCVFSTAFIHDIRGLTTILQEYSRFSYLSEVRPGAFWIWENISFEPSKMGKLDWSKWTKSPFCIVRFNNEYQCNCIYLYNCLRIIYASMCEFKHL